MHPTEFGNLEFDRRASARESGAVGDIAAKTWKLAKTRNRFVWPLLTAALAVNFALLIVVLSLPEVMSQSLYHEVNVGLAAVCAQLAVTVAAFWAYCSWAAARFDGPAISLRLAAEEAKSGGDHV